MLTFRRRPGEAIVIGDPKSPIGKVRFVRSQGGQAILAFDFPREISVHREEVARNIATHGEKKPEAP